MQPICTGGKKQLYKATFYLISQKSMSGILARRAIGVIKYLKSLDFIFTCEVMVLQIEQFCEKLGRDMPLSLPWRRDRSLNHVEEPDILEPISQIKYDEATRALAIKGNNADLIIYYFFGGVSSFKRAKYCHVLSRSSASECSQFMRKVI